MAEDTQEQKKSSKAALADRGDALDAGVDMLEGHPSEPVGPEDALGDGPKRGDYRDRIHTDPHTSELIPEDEQEEGGPTTRLVAQAPKAEDIGDVPGEKGGVTTG